jgi:hypothetical protein
MSKCLVIPDPTSSTVYMDNGEFYELGGKLFLTFKPVTMDGELN